MGCLKNGVCYCPKCGKVMVGSVNGICVGCSLKESFKDNQQSWNKKYE